MGQLTLALVAVGWLVGWWLWGRPRQLPPEPADGSRPGDPGALPRMSIIVPARDEAVTLPLLLGDLASHRPPGSEVIVVDDGSTDATATLAAANDFVTVLDAGERPADWLGKSWACRVGATHATGELLCFVDADVRLAPGALEAVARQVTVRGGLVSVQPWHATERPYEQASALFGVVALMGIGAGGRSEPSGAFGPVMASHRDDYELVGGHGAVRSEIVEDLALADAYREADRATWVFTGGDLVSFRMYPSGVRSLLEGWTKNFASGAADTGLPRLLGIVAWLTAMGTTVVALWDSATGSGALPPAVAAWAAFALQLRAVFRPVGRFGLVTAALYPLWLAVFFAVFFRSMWCTLVRHEVTWRGRSVPVGVGGRS